MRKSERYKRNLRIAKFREDNPEYSLDEIGEKFGITGSAIFYILKRLKNNQVLVKNEK